MGSPPKTAPFPRQGHINKKKTNTKTEQQTSTEQICFHFLSSTVPTEYKYRKETDDLFIMGHCSYIKDVIDANCKYKGETMRMPFLTPTCIVTRQYD